MAAIYMWFSDEEIIVLTTTLYPVDAEDYLQLAGSIVSGTMTLPYTDHAIDILPAEFVSASYIQKRWYYEYGPDEDHFEILAAEFVSTSYIRIRVIGEAPPEELQLDFTIKNTSTMVPA